jgi:iron complex transport system substrate-binding protein
MKADGLLSARAMRWSNSWFLVATLVGCDAFPGEQPSAGVDDAGASRASYPLQLVDDAGMPHTFEAAPRRMVSLVPSATEALLAMDLADRLVGRTDYDRTPELADLPSVGGGLQPNLEVLVSLDLDLVIRFAGDSDLATAERLTELGIAHFAVQPDGIGDVLNIIRDLGEISDASDAADAMLREISDELTDVARRVSALPEPRVAYLLGGDPPWVAGPGTYIDELIAVAGGTNVFDDLGPLYAPVSMEALLDRDLDLILLSNGLTTPSPLAHVPSVVMPASVEIPGPGLGRAARDIARLIHPGAFDESPR